MIIGIALLALLATVLLVILFTGGGDGGPGGSASPSTSALASPSTPANASASASASAEASAGASATQMPGTAFALDDVVRTAVEALTLRGGPGLSAEILWRLPAGTLGIVISEGSTADGYTWYQLSGMGLPYGSGCVTPERGELLDCPAFVGWVASAGPDGTAWLEAAEPGDCPTGQPSVEVLALLPYTMRLICYGAEPMTYGAFWPELPDDAGLGGACAAGETAVAWLVCQNINSTVLTVAGEAPTGTGLSFPINIDPASGVTMPERGQWVEVTGHFDDPAAQGCGEAADEMESDPDALVFNCRWEFVLSSVTPAEAP